MNLYAKVCIVLFLFLRYFTKTPDVYVYGWGLFARVYPKDFNTAEKEMLSMSLTYQWVNSWGFHRTGW